ncbi:MAG: conjugal transfer protein TraH [Rickettsiales bacterium]|jgi:conjugative transfer pilus assembly protein TraH|nr:conjugal transfer protein TraH [Rickettsiales bacterium]
MFRFYFFIALSFFLLLNINIAFSDLKGEMDIYWVSWTGGGININQAVLEQQAGYYTGGSIRARVPVLNVNPINIQPPKLSGGCGGIDMFTGSFSHINTDQFIASLKAIGSNSVGYAFQLALDTLSPKIKSIVDGIQNTIDMINNININSCEMAKTLVNAPFDKTVGLAESGCAMGRLLGGQSSDADAAKKDCQSYL